MRSIRLVTSFILHLNPPLQNFKVIRKKTLRIRDFGAILKQRRIWAPFDVTSVHAPVVEMLLLARARPAATPRRQTGWRCALLPFIRTHLHRTGMMQVLADWLIG